MITDFLDALDQYSNLVIALLTIAITYLAYRSLHSDRESIRLSALPILFPKIKIDFDVASLIVENHSDNPAYDLDIWVIGHYDEQVLPYKHLLSKEYKNKIKIDFSKSLFEYTTHYGVIDRILQLSFPPKTKSVIKLDFIEVPNTAELVMQFRDSMGYNYLYQSWLFSASPNTPKEDLRVGFLKSGFKPAKRIDYVIGISTTNIKNSYLGLFKATKHIFLPWRFIRIIPMVYEELISKMRTRIYLDSNIRDTLQRSFSSGYQDTGRDPVEGRGIISPL